MLPRRRTRAPGSPGQAGTGGPRAALLVSLAAALAASAALLGAPAASAHAAGAPVSAAPVAAASGTPAEEPEEPLAVVLDTLSPAVVPKSGPVQVTGSVTNESDETWTNVNLYAFSSGQPITTPEGLDEALDVDTGTAVGRRVVASGTFDSVDDLEPGDTAGFTLRVPRDRLDIPAGQPGIYWFGVHALGTNVDGRDSSADGRARTFLAALAEDSPQLPVSLVLPLRRPVVHAPDGSIDDVARWVRDLEPEGRLRSILDFAEAGSDVALTWLADPAVLAAADRLAAGNPPRSIAPTRPARTGPSGGASPSAPGGGSDGSDGSDGTSPDSPGSSATGSPSDDASADGGVGPPGEAADTPVERRAAELADVWAKRLRGLLADAEVMALPYADLDVAGALVQEPGAYARAASFSQETLDAAGVSSAPVFAPPSGLADAETVAGLAEGTTALLSERAVEDGDREGSPVREVAGRDVVLTDSSATAGGPGPSDPLGSVQVRQRLLAETAMHSLSGDDSPMTAVLPRDWLPDDARGFFLGIEEAPWIRLATMGAATGGLAEETDPEALSIPEGEEPELIGRRNFRAVRGLTEKGRLLEDVLTRNDAVGGVVAREALGAASYPARDFRGAWRRVNRASAATISAQLGSVRVEAPPSVTLSSEEGKFAASLANDLGQPVTVRIEARTDSPVELRAPETIALAPGESTSVLVTARTSRIGLHDVELVVTAPDGVPLGSRAELPIRSAQVSWIIWVVIAVGATMLFGAIAVRLVRRLLSRRAAPAPGGAA